MREIKFRAWHPELKVLIYFDNLGFSHGPRLRYCLFAEEDSNTVYHAWHTKVELQQFTGLKDVDGREIYEGDIVYVNGRNRAIEWRNGGFYCTWSDYPLNSIWFMGGSPLIVGNIMENPELLNNQEVKSETKIFKEEEGLLRCPNCDERAWDGRLCHICGAKEI